MCRFRSKILSVYGRRQGAVSSLFDENMPCRKGDRDDPGFLHAISGDLSVREFLKLLNHKIKSFELTSFALSIKAFAQPSKEHLNFGSS